MPAPSTRSTSHAVAAILNLVLSLVSIGLSIGPLWRGADANAAAGDQPPFFILVLSIALGAVGIVSSYGVWRGQRWGVVLTIVLQALQFLSGVPGVIFGPTTFLVVGSIVGCVANIAIVYLLLRRTRVRAAATTTAHA